MSKWLIILLIFSFSLSLRLWTINQMGRTWDESQYIEQGYKMIELIKNGDFNNSFFYTTYDHPPLVKYLYGTTAHLDVEKRLANGNAIFKYDLTYSRLLSAVLFSLGVVITILIGWKISSKLVGFFSGVILAMLPFSLGLSQLVTTESLKIFIYPLTILAYILLVERFSWRRVLVSGILTGIALQSKQSNFLLILMLCVAFLFQYKQLKTKEKIIFLQTRIKAILSIFLISIMVFVLIWPQLIFHFKDVYMIHEKLWNVQFSSKIWQITLSPPEVFFGKLMLTPIFYYAVYFFITIPVIILFLFFVGAKQIIKKRNVNLILVFIWFLLPFCLSIYSWRQHGLRYIIEIYPPLSLISAVGFNLLLTKFKIKERLKPFYFLPIAFYLFVLLLQIKPYYLDYFNELVGGVNNVYGYKSFQIGWWGQGIREAAFYVGSRAPKNSTLGLAVSPLLSVPPLPNLKSEKYDHRKIYDYVIVNYYNVLREGFDDSFIREKYKPIYFVKANEAILVTVYKLK
ncbi:MAG: glycosyltransferase family 39 protein [Candidatus Levybacteria bacterium]|nr:glycosyltransferase family 39 protein [Candidatus Levybacteria bacterium]